MRSLTTVSATNPHPIHTSDRRRGVGAPISVQKMSDSTHSDLACRALGLVLIYPSEGSQENCLDRSEGDALDEVLLDVRARRVKGSETKR